MHRMTKFMLHLGPSKPSAVYPFNFQQATNGVMVSVTVWKLVSMDSSSCIPAQRWMGSIAAMSSVSADSSSDLFIFRQDSAPADRTPETI